MLIIDASDRIILAFKGTTSSANMITDLKVHLSNFTGMVSSSLQHTKASISENLWNKAKIHTGFLKAYTSISHQVIDEVRQMLLKGERPIFLCGHSLGGALATLCAADLHLSLSVPTSTISVSTFGSPRCGNRFWASMYDQIIQRHWRFEVETDIVTKVPSSHFYTHVGKKVLLTPTGALLLDPSGIETGLWGEVSNLSSHKKESYFLCLLAFCDNYLKDFKPELWSFKVSKNGARTMKGVLSNEALSSLLGKKLLNKTHEMDEMV